MPFIRTEIQDLVIFEPKVFKDDRGYFLESYNEKTFNSEGLDYKFIQDNESKSSYGTLRGLHLQRGDHAQAKLVRCIRGEVLDVVVDLRSKSSTFGKSFSIVLSEENHRQLLIPRGFAHGFVVLSESAVFLYKVDNYYNKESEDGIIFNDSTLNIDWKIPLADIILSPKDRELGSFDDFCSRS